MPLSNKCVQEYLLTVCKQIRFKCIHNSITKELSDHIDDQKNEYIRQGLDEETASIKAVEQMGDPVLVGRQLDRAHRPKTEWSVLSLTAILVIIGGVVQFFLSGVAPNNSHMFSHFLIYAPVGIAAFIFAYFFDYTLLGRYSKLTYFLLFTATIVDFLILNREHGAYRHAYYSVLLFIPAFAGIIYGFRNNGYLGIIASGVFYAGAAFICIQASSFSSLLFFTVSCLIILTVAIEKGFLGCNKKVSLAIVYVPTIITLLLTVIQPIIQRKLSIMVNPKLDTLGYGYQHLMVRRLFASSQLLGKAVLGGDIDQMGIDRLLPGWATDFSLTYIIARLGYIAGLAIVAVMLVFIVRMFISVTKQKNAYGFLVSFSVCLAITGQIVLYVLSNTGVIAPFAGILPFISFGGMGFVVNMMLVGLLLSVYRRTDIVKDRMKRVVSNRRLLTVEDGKLIIDLGIKTLENTGREKKN